MDRTRIAFRKHLVRGLFIGVVALLFLRPGEAGAVALAQSCGQWKIVPSPSAGTLDILRGIAAISPQDVWAVGDYVGATGFNQVLIEHWDGRLWSLVPSPNPGPARSYLNGVEAVSSTDVWVVGGTAAANWTNSNALIEHWDGTSWSLVPSPGAGGALSGVSALSSDNVWAVGSNGQTLVEQWNGAQWSIIPSPNPGAFGNGLGSVAALSSTDVWAVGSSAPTQFGEQTLAEHWNGTKWRVVKTPPLTQFANELRAISAVAANDIWATGDYTVPPGDISLTLTEHWNGTKWSVVSSPSPTGDDGLFGVAAVSTSDVWAVGDYSSGGQNLVEQWNGTSWNTVPSPFRRHTISSLLAVSADSAADVWAAGFDINKQNFTYQTLIEHYC